MSTEQQVRDQLSEYTMLTPAIDAIIHELKQSNGLKDVHDNPTAIYALVTGFNAGHAKGMVTGFNIGHNQAMEGLA